MRIRLYHAYGTERDWFDDPDLIGLTRDGSRDFPGSGLAFLCTNGRGGRKRMEVGKRFAGRTFVCAIGERSPVTIDRDGWGEFEVRDGGCSVYVPASGPIVKAWRLVQDVKRIISGRTAALR